MKRALPYLVPLAAIAAVSGLVPVIAGLHQTVTGNGPVILRDLLGDPAVLYTARISVLYAICATACLFAVAVPLAVTLSLRPGLFPAFLVVLSVPAIAPVFIAGPVWRLFFHGSAGDSIFRTLTGINANLLTDPVAAFVSVLFTGTWKNLPAAILVLYSGLRRIPSAGVDAARMDGVLQWELARHVLLPQVRGLLAIVAVVSLVEGFGEFTLPFVMTAGGPPLMSGITADYVVGATTTVELFLYDIFTFSGDLRMPAVYSTAMLLVFAGLGTVWALVRRRSQYRSDDGNVGGRPGPSRALAAVTVVLVIVFGRTIPSLALAALLAVAALLRRPVLTGLAGVGLLVSGVIALVSRGFLGGFQPSIVVALAFIPGIVPRLQRRRARTLKPGPRLGARALPAAGWRALQALAVTGVVLSVAVFVYLLAWIGFSGVDSAYVDSFFPRFVGTANFSALFSDRGFYIALRNSFVLAGLTALVTVLVTLPAAAAVATFGAGGRSIFYSLQFLRLSGGIHSLIPLFAVFLALRLVNTYVPLVLLYAFQASPLAFAVIHGFVRDLPRGLFDQARSDGASGFQYVTRVLVPLCGPPVMSAALLAFLAAWNGFLVPLLFLTQQDRFPLSIYLHNAVGSIAAGTPSWGVFAAGSLLNMILLAVLFSATRKPFLSSSAAQVE